MITSSWQPVDDVIEAFLTEFERRGADPSDDLGQFADRFIVGDPNHGLALTREQLSASLPQRRRLFDGAGVQAAHLVDAAQLDLDDHHALVTTEWDAQRIGQAPIRLESTFMIRRDEGAVQILVYLNHRDIIAALKPVK